MTVLIRSADPLKLCSQICHPSVIRHGIGCSADDVSVNQHSVSAH